MTSQNRGYYSTSRYSHSNWEIILGSFINKYISLCILILEIKGENFGSLYPLLCDLEFITDNMGT